MEIDYSPLLRHLNSLSRTEQQAFAENCGTTLNYMRKRICLKLPFGFPISKNIARAGLMKPEELRPDDWDIYIWNA